MTTRRRNRRCNEIYIYRLWEFVVSRRGGPPAPLRLSSPPRARKPQMGHLFLARLDRARKRRKTGLDRARISEQVIRAQSSRGYALGPVQVYALGPEKQITRSVQSPATRFVHSMDARSVQSRFGYAIGPVVRSVQILRRLVLLCKHITRHYDRLIL